MGQGLRAGPEGPAGPGQALASDLQDRRLQGCGVGKQGDGTHASKAAVAAEACSVLSAAAQAGRGDG